MASLISLHPTPPIPKRTTIDLVGGILCNKCNLTFTSKKDYDTHYATHGQVTDITYTCNICFKDIVGYSSFRGHCYTSHVVKERFRCEYCFKQLSRMNTLKEHIELVHKIKCPLCSKEFPTKKEMQLHQIIHNVQDQPPYECKTCKNEIETVEECKDHVEMHIKNTYFCPICNDCILDPEDAADHFKEHFGDDVIDDGFIDIEIPKQSEETYIEEMGGIFCEFCSCVLKNRVEFDAHFSCEHGDEDIVYKCVACGKTYEKYSQFKSHCYDHCMRNRYECHLCGKAFPRSSLLATHALACEASGAAHKPFACAACPQRFACEDRWRSHLRLQHCLRGVPCPRMGCPAVFETRKEVLLHQQSHDSKIRHYCIQCKLLITNVTACERHMEIHKRKVYICPVCNRNTKDKTVIMNHVCQHFETVLHLCNVCGKVFNARNRLLEHMKSHSTKKLYSCTLCDRSFNKSEILKQHMNTHTGSKPFICPVCERPFASLPNCRKHIRRMHHEESLHIKMPSFKNMFAIKVKDEVNSVEKLAENDEEISTDNTTDTNDTSASNTEEQVSGADELMSDVDTNKNATDAERLNDIDNANASIDFASIKLETYIFSVNDVPMEVDNIPSIQLDKNLFIEANTENGPVEGQLFSKNNVDNAIVEEIFSRSPEQNSLVEKYSGNPLENVPVDRDLFQESVSETPNPDDILEYIAEMPENNSMFIPAMPQEALVATAGVADARFPCEYGPEFNNGLAACGSGVVDLDDHILPHIDPLLTIRSETLAQLQPSTPPHPLHPSHPHPHPHPQPTDYETLSKWEPPIITKLYDEYSYGFDVAEGRLSVMNADIF